MAILTLSNILDDLRVTEEALHRFERRYWLSSSAFYDLYSKGFLDDGSHAEDFSEWAGHYKLKLKREAALEQLSRRRIEQLQRQFANQTIELAPQEPALELA
ncbi:MAG: hypothetical protein CVU38_00035 [Chloroflexi bacterium HGW-Chloroflexi-1]|nr:MAG: hypothetical protein CVU38_00035 [Chloroflexi bacterium HGW-Chloroflexi-1]